MDFQYNITYREKDKGWQYIISYKINSTDKWKQKSKQGFKKKVDAKKAADKMLTELKEILLNDMLIESDLKDITLNDFYAIYKKDNELYQTIHSMHNMKAAVNAFSLLGNKRLKDIKSKDIQEIIDSLYRRGLKHTSVKTRYDYIKVLFNSAKKKYKILSNNVCEDVRLLNDKTEVDRTALTDSQVDDLLNALLVRPKDYRYYVIALLAVTGGFRIGEILGLTKSDFDFNEESISINKQFKLIADKTCGLGPLKSKNSNRVVPMPSSTMDILKSYIDSNVPATDGRIFDFGNNRSFQKVINRRFKVLGFDVCMHELRHTYATKLISSGVDFKTAAYLLGHDVEMTMNTYTHVNNDMINNARNIIKKNFDT